jgi:type I restriction enzyme, S subunit
MSLPRYPEYKDSRVEWLGDVPAHWTITRIQDVANVVNGYPFDARLFETEIGYPLIRIRDLDSSETVTRYNGDFVEEAAVTSDDVLIGMDGDFNVGRWLGDGLALLNQRMCCIRTERSNLATMLRYALPTPLKAINDITYATTVKHLSSFQVQKLRIALPRDESELSAIATFLERETGKIDSLIAEQEMLLTLLAEKRQATISHAVTKGLNPEAPMKDFGVEWLGEMPAHWNVLRVKDVSQLESGHTPSKQFPEYWENCEIPWVSLNDSKYLAANDFISDTAVRINELGMANSSARLLPAESVVFTRDATIGLAAITTRPMAVSQHLIAWCPTGKMAPKYLLRVFNAMKNHLDSYTFGATIKTIGMGDVKTLTTPVPPLQEQLKIVEFLDTKLSQIDGLTYEATRAINLLKERRSALISAAVTGKIDVRHLANQEAA